MAEYSTIQSVKPKQKIVTSLFDTEEETITLRDEQKKAVADALRRFKKKSGDKFLWNAKMRFGKTLCALQLAREMGEWEGDAKVRRTIIVTHRPVVNKSWSDDFAKIFHDKKGQYLYGTKFDDDSFGNFYDLEQQVEKQGKHYIFFASMQYLRRSTLVGGDNDEQLKQDILMNKWDLVVIDEAHEGTRTALGQRVIKLLTENPDTKTLHLSGTPFNLYDDFTDEEIFTWDYIKEQQAKRDWPQKHRNEPEENNPYRDLPEMEIRTYNLGNLVHLKDNATFSFKDFFQVWTGNPKADGKIMPEDCVKGTFMREESVNDFLDLLCKEDETSHYPFSTDEYREMFKHTLWVVPGVKEAKALEILLNKHEVFGEFDAIINVAGSNEDDETRSDALDKVTKKIGDCPELTQTITISCGRLTTGVTVKPWTAVFYLKGSENTSAATYMQTIFRVQSPYNYKDADGNLQMKTKCYVFDFAPDRSIKMVAETAKFATLTQKERSSAQATSREKDIQNMKDFLSFCPVISLEGGQMVKYEPERLFEQLEHVYVDRVVRNGFNDNSLYDLRELMNLSPEELGELNDLGAEIEKSTNMEKPKKAVDISKNGLSKKQKEAAKRAKEKQKQGVELTPEEIAALEAEKKRREEERKERDNRITILRGISLRIPLMMYGAEVDDEDEGITIDNFTEQIDPASWREFMPRGVSKQMFNAFKKCYNATVFAAAGKRYRQLAREADTMHTDERIQRIAEIFSYFHNPDKETVLTPWRVVNMHMSDCLGGYCFFNERFDGPNQKPVIGDGDQLFDWIDTTAPRFVNRGKVTSDVFGDIDKQYHENNSKILEINSKTGLYPLYVAYSLYRYRMPNYAAVELVTDLDSCSIEEEQVIWNDILKHNIYVICNTPMAARITKRTLCGFRDVKHINIKSDKLVERATTDKDSLVNAIKTIGYWEGTTKKDMIKFSAVVGNPPYQVMDGGAGVSAKPVYNSFVDIAKALMPGYLSMIMPAKWYTDGKGLGEFRATMLNDKRLQSLYDFTDSRDCFATVDIAGGVCYFLWNSSYNGKCQFTNIHKNERTSILRNLGETDEFIRHIQAVSIIDKVKNNSDKYFDSRVRTQKPFGLRTYVEPLSQGDITLKYNKGKGPYDSSLITIGKEMIDQWKVIISCLTAEHAGQTDKDGKKKILSSLDMLAPKEICTETYMVVDSFPTEVEAYNLTTYLKTLFVRFLISQLAATQHLSKDKFRLVPIQDFTSSSDIDWKKPIEEIDKQLYNKYGLTDSDIDFIESMIKPME